MELRHLSEDQLGSYIDIVARSRADHPYERRLTMEEARVWTLADPDFKPEASWVAYLDGEAAGFAAAQIESNRIAAGMNDGFVDVEVVPEHRNKGIERRLMDLCVEYLRSKGVGKARARGVVSDVWKRSLLEPDSFEEEYRVYILVRRGRSEVRAAPVPEGFALHRKPLAECSDAYIATAVETFNDSFRDHFSFAPEKLERWINFRDSAKDLGVLTLAMIGDEAVGLCVSEESMAFNEERGVRAGWVDILGVRPKYRRRGLARALLADGITLLLEKGLDTVYIGVYAKNEKALDLYRSFGFEKDGESIWYSKRLS
jgi:mycothiol synthase